MKGELSDCCGAKVGRGATIGKRGHLQPAVYCTKCRCICGVRDRRSVDPKFLLVRPCNAEKARRIIATTGLRRIKDIFLTVRYTDGTEQITTIHSLENGTARERRRT